MQRVPRVRTECRMCGTEMWATVARLNCGRGHYCSKQCGGAAAVARGQVAYKGRHGLSRNGNGTYSTWESMRCRCNTPTASGYERYGGRGIKVCKRWELFENFLSDMGERPPEMSLDRIDPNGDYAPENCRWATWPEQCRNTRRNRIIAYEGSDWCITDLASHLRVDLGTLRYRIKTDWPSERWGKQTRSHAMRP